MQILIHTVDNPPYPDVDPGSMNWSGSPPDLVQPSLYFGHVALCRISCDAWKAVDQLVSP